MAGLEPATFGFVDRCSIQLSYTRLGWRDGSRIADSCPHVGAVAWVMPPAGNGGLRAPDRSPESRCGDNQRQSKKVPPTCVGRGFTCPWKASRNSPPLPPGTRSRASFLDVASEATWRTPTHPNTPRTPAHLRAPSCTPCTSAYLRAPSCTPCTPPNRGSPRRIRACEAVASPVSSSWSTANRAPGQLSKPRPPAAPTEVNRQPPPMPDSTRSRSSRSTTPLPLMSSRHSEHVPHRPSTARTSP
jgi:hypothetical protein